MSAPQEAPHTQFKFQGSPIAATYEQMRTVKQLWCLNAIERTGVDVDAVCFELLGCKVADLSIRAASALIGHLKERA